MTDKERFEDLERKATRWLAENFCVEVGRNVQIAIRVAIDTGVICSPGAKITGKAYIRELDDLCNVRRPPAPGYAGKPTSEHPNPSGENAVRAMEDG